MPALHQRTCRGGPPWPPLIRTECIRTKPTQGGSPWLPLIRTECIRTKPTQGRPRWAAPTRALRERVRLISFFLAMGLCALVSVPARASTQYGDITVSVVPRPGSKGHGYAEYRVRVTNLSQTAAHDVTVAAPQSGSVGGSIEASRRVRVEASSTVEVSLFAPAGMYGTGLAIEVDGRSEDEIVPLNLSQHGSYGTPSVLISKGAATAGFQGFSAVLTNPTGGLSYSPASSEPNVANWSNHWLGFAGYDGVVLTASEIGQLPAEVSKALWNYVECGGSLFVIGATEVPQPWRARKENGPLPTYYVGFGQCVVGEAGDLKSLNKAQWEYVRSTWQDSLKPWPVETVLPVGANHSVPVRGMFVVMLLFVALIGPINMIFLSRKKKRMWLLWTVPLISLLTCLAVSAYSIASEGFSGHAQTVSLTILDETSHRATTLGLMGFYTPLTPGEGLRFSYDTEVTSQEPRSYEYGYGQGLPVRTIDWTQDQHLDSGWITARMPANFKIRRSETRRERIVISKEPGGSLSVVNGLGAPIRKLWVADADGKIYESGAIDAGASAVMALTRAYGTAGGDNDALRRPYTDSWLNLYGDYQHWLRPRTFLALLDSCPFMEEGLRGVKDRKSDAAVYGIMKETPDAN